MDFELKGVTVKGVEVEPLSSLERWNEYQMPNGDIVRAKLVATRFFNAPGHRNPDGSPLYSIEFSTVVKAIPPQEVKGG